MYNNFGQFYDGKWNDSENKSTYEVINPCNEEVIGNASNASMNDVDKALKSANIGLQKWRQYPAWQRGSILRKAADLIRKHKEVIAKYISLEVGKPLKIRFRVTNVDEGHNLPSGSLGAQPEIWMNVAVLDPDGERIFESGYVDSYGDMADIHSLDVAAGKIAYDEQLVNFQTKFLTTNIKGTDREMYLPVNFDVDQKPFLRPSEVPTSVQNHPPLVRMEGRSIPPLGWRDAKYKVPAEKMTKKGTYKILARMRSRAEPLYFMKISVDTREDESSH